MVTRDDMDFVWKTIFATLIVVFLLFAATWGSVAGKKGKVIVENGVEFKTYAWTEDASKVLENVVNNYKIDMSALKKVDSELEIQFTKAVDDLAKQMNVELEKANVKIVSLECKISKNNSGNLKESMAMFQRAVTAEAMLETYKVLAKKQDRSSEVTELQKQISLLKSNEAKIEKANTEFYQSNIVLKSDLKKLTKESADYKIDADNKYENLNDFAFIFFFWSIIASCLAIPTIFDFLKTLTFN